MNHSAFDASMANLPKNLETGSVLSLGIAGVPGPSTSASDQPDRAPTDVSFTPDNGLSAFQGRLVAISSPWSAEREGEFTLTVYFDSQTHQRLVEKVYGEDGRLGTDVAVFCLMIVNEEPRTT